MHLRVENIRILRLRGERYFGMVDNYGVFPSGEERTRLLMEHARSMVYCYNADQIPMIKKYGDLPIAIRSEVNPGDADAVALDSAAAAVKTADLAEFIRNYKKSITISK